MYSSKNATWDKVKYLEWSREWLFYTLREELRDQIDKERQGIKKAGGDTT